MKSDLQSREKLMTPPTDRLRQKTHKQKQRRTRALIAVGTAVSLVIGGTVIALVTGGSETQVHAVKPPSALHVLARPEQSPPQDLIAAGRVAVSGYYTTKIANGANGDAVGTYTWSLYNAAAKRYQRTDWAWVDVAPGMRTAAVLERDLPADRIGMLNMATGKVQRWIKVDKGIGGVQFSPDGKRLVATTYSLNPDGLFTDASYRLNDKKVPGPKPSRTGFYVIDLATDKVNFSTLPPRKDGLGGVVGAGRQDLHWSPDGKLLWEPAANKTGKVYYNEHGHKSPVPEREASLPSPGGVLSPDGVHITGNFAGGDGQIVSEILDAKTGKRSALVPGQQLLAWADNDHLIAWRCDPKQCEPGKGEFRNQLLLVGLNGDTVPLSGFRQAKLRDESRWTPVLSER
ncbi:hypothetical protein J7F01_14760 [Streptomyces sp. ISL-22]|uniref:hypothetical protein n=1 Tax=unclassified Streptomyces TaxID=2593676 RepID=UPI001BE97D67|nr:MULTISPECIES: hypothetical protein [unclassified Streptomyces]MBT2421886.1 hypothetical protein [Streptomyces sp. ISL-24]MBT2433436.1 hypothetical protein [Streptomyces sp. ISL-22]